MRGDGPPYVKFGRSVRYGESRSGQVDSVTHTILDERALETRRLFHGNFDTTGATLGLITENVEMMIVAGSRYKETRQKLSFARSAGNRSLGVVPLHDFVVPDVGNGRTVALAYRQSMSSEMPKRAANAMLDQLEVRADQVWGLYALHPSSKTAPQQPEPVSGSVARSSTPLTTGRSALARHVAYRVPGWPPFGYAQYHAGEGSHEARERVLTRSYSPFECARKWRPQAHWRPRLIIRRLHLALA